MVDSEAIKTHVKAAGQTKGLDIHYDFFYSRAFAKWVHQFTAHAERDGRFWEYADVLCGMRHTPQQAIEFFDNKFFPGAVNAFLGFDWTVYDDEPSGKAPPCDCGFEKNRDTMADHAKWCSYAKWRDAR